MFLLLWIVFAMVIGMWAGTLDRSAIGYFLIALIFSPLIAFLILAIVGRNRRHPQVVIFDYKKCPDCGKTIRRDARECPYCYNAQPQEVDSQPV